MKSRLVLAMAGVLVLSACGHLRMPQIWPFHKKPKPIPGAVHELDLVNADGSSASFKQYWRRNTLVIDLSGVSGEGTLTAKLPEGNYWPVRVAPGPMSNTWFAGTVSSAGTGTVVWNVVDTTMSYVSVIVTGVTSHSMSTMDSTSPTSTSSCSRTDPICSPRYRTAPGRARGGSV